MWVKYVYDGLASMLVLALAWWLFLALPSDLFEDPTSTVLTNQENQLLAAHIADDGQWRFPARDTVPYKFTLAITQFEDRNFFRHSGMHIPSLFRALWQNLTSGEVVRGGSTISMQVIRLSRKGQSRTIFEKVIELLLAARMEMTYSKEEILAMYASHAPYGGNVVGIDAASWRYFGRPPEDLSWAETATLAVLPNAPSLIYPGRNKQRLKDKRDRLLRRLHEIGAISEEDASLAQEEELPEKPHPLPNIAPHLLTRIMNDGKKGERVIVTLDMPIQNRVNDIVERHYHQLSANGIENAAVLVMEVNSGNVLAYVGNTPGKTAGGGHNVDIIMAPRSTGSIIKPFLYAGMLNDGELLPQTLVADIPIQMEGFAPKNYNYKHDGVVPASMALSRSLNIPAVNMLHEYGIEKFLHLLERLNQTHINKSADHYGLSLILGGAESSLWDLCGAYGSMSRSLNNWHNTSGKYDPYDYRAPNYEPYLKGRDDGVLEEHGRYSAGTIWLTWQALQKVNRPDNALSWEDFSSSARVAWKTGTSFGNRDAWAIGTTRNYIVGVWTGNADGEGRPNMTGVGSAAPIMFDVLDLLPSDPWFPAPLDDMEEIEVCRQTGYRPLDICPDRDSMFIPEKGLLTPPCPYHRLVHLTPDGAYRTSTDCEQPANIKTEAWFVLPPVAELYYRQRHPSYRKLPPIDPNCDALTDQSVMDFVYPQPNAKIYIPIELDGTPGEAIFEIAHRKEGTTIYWHLDETYLGSTKQFHQMGVRPAIGEHIIVAIDEFGNQLFCRFEVLSE